MYITRHNNIIPYFNAKHNYCNHSFFPSTIQQIRKCNSVTFDEILHYEENLTKLPTIKLHMLVYL